MSSHVLVRTLHAHSTAGPGPRAGVRPYPRESFRERHVCKVGLAGSPLKCKTLRIQKIEPVSEGAQKIDAAKPQTLAPCHEVSETLVQSSPYRFMGVHGTANAALVAEYGPYLWRGVFRKRYPCKVGLTSQYCSVSLTSC